MSEADIIQLRQDVKAQLQKRVLAAIQAVLDEEIAECLGVSKYERGDTRQGYRNGATEREITTSSGSKRLKVPVLRIVTSDTRESGRRHWKEHIASAHKLLELLFDVPAWQQLVPV